MQKVTTPETEVVADRRRSTELLTIGLIFSFLLLVAFVLRELDLQTSAFRRVVLIAAFGFVVHHLLSQRWRMPFFVGLSMASTLEVLGGTPASRFADLTVAVSRFSVILVVGGTLIGICHLRIGFWQRLGLLGVVGAVAAVFRAGIVDTSVLNVAWIVLAAMFMFRIVMYLYDLSSSNMRVSASQTLAYFFLLPNACITLFPLIDFKKFVTSYFNEPALVIYRRGVRWIGRGIGQLLLYRIVDQLLLVKANEVSSGTDVVVSLVTSAFMYLKVSGSFHLVIGLLLLFGFNLPETHHRYFLASSFNDYWRRVNIYWKDFMMKIFYYPAFFKLKRFGATQALVLSTAWVFTLTWALHLYQTWWLKRDLVVTWPDTLFWGILGLLVLVNSLWELKRGRKRVLASSTYSASDAFWLSLRTAGTFACICVLWSLWSTPNLRTWIAMWRHADVRTVVWGLAVLGTVAAAKVLLEVWPTWRKSVPTAARSPFVLLGRETFQATAVLLLILVVAKPPALLAALDEPRFQPMRDALTADASITTGSEGGYYENLAGAGPGDRELWETLTRASIAMGYDGADPRRKVMDLRYRELIPNVRVTAWLTDISTNRWGMRDRDYDLVKPPGTVRIAVLGTSQVMGWGVPQSQVFESIIERRLNVSPPPNLAGVRYEVLNFAVPGYGPLAQLTLLQNRIRSFQPDIVLLVGHWTDPGWQVYYLWRAMHEGVSVEDPFIKNVLREARVGRRTNEKRALERLRQFERPLLEWSYRQIVEECRRIGAVPYWTYLHVIQPEEPPDPGGESAAVRLTRFATQAGFVTDDISGALANRNVVELLTSDPDDPTTHWNAKAHHLIADAIYLRLTTDPRIGLPRIAREALSASAILSSSPHLLNAK
jgi:hypothetical protein